MRCGKFWCPKRDVAPPIGDDPTHKPLKTRLSLDFSSCNRRILVYGLVYGSDGGECLWAYGGIVYGPDLRLGYGFRQVDGFDYAGG